MRGDFPSVLYSIKKRNYPNEPRGWHSHPNRPPARATCVLLHQERLRPPQPRYLLCRSAPSRRPGRRSSRCRDRSGICRHTGTAGSSRGRTGLACTLQGQEGLGQGEHCLAVSLFCGIRKLLRHLHLLTLKHDISESAAVVKFRLPHALPKLQPSCPEEVPRMEIITGVKTGADSPTENILGSAQESCCQHPGSALSPAPVSPAWLGCQCVLAKSLPSQNVTLRINPFHRYSCLAPIAQFCCLLAN